MRYSKKGWEKRKKEREGYKQFFEECSKEIRDNNYKCKECGTSLKGHVSEVAHILPKSYYKSIATNKINWIPLCGMYSKNQCHTKFDNTSNKKFKEMLVYKEINRIFTELEGIVEETIPYKTYDRYTD